MTVTWNFHGAAPANALAEAQKVAAAGQISRFLRKIKTIRGILVCNARDSSQSNSSWSSLTSYFQTHPHHSQHLAPSLVQLTRLLLCPLPRLPAQVAPLSTGIDPFAAGWPAFSCGKTVLNRYWQALQESPQGTNDSAAPIRGIWIFSLRLCRNLPTGHAGGATALGSISRACRPDSSCHRSPPCPAT